MQRHLAILSTCALAAFAGAQSSTATTTVDQGGVGCQSQPGLLSGGVAASADVTVDYDQSTRVMTLTVDNTTPIVAGEANAVITRLYFNVPPGAVTSATLLSQSGAGGAAPAFSLAFVADNTATPNPNRVGCMGNFHAQLKNPNGAHGAIANASAPSISAPGYVVGPVTFEIELDGPGAHGIDAATILASYSQGGSTSSNFGAKFQAAGSGGEESGFLGSGDECRTAMYTVGPTAVGETFELCVTGGYGCHACVWVSGTPGPVTVGGIEIPIGLPIVGAYTLGNFGLNGAGSSFCIPVEVPNDPTLSGFEFYTANITYNALNLSGYQFSPGITITID